MAFGIPEDRAPKLTYGDYLAIDQLTTLQTLKSDPPRHDELLFIIIHQVYELWFKQLLHELDAIVLELRDKDTLGAARLLRRCIEIERVLIQQVLASSESGAAAGDALAARVRRLVAGLEALRRRDAAGDDRDALVVR